MSGLTEEQRRRMEENRLKALQKRSKQQISSGGNLSSIPTATGTFSSNRNTSESDVKASFSGSAYQLSNPVMSAASDTTIQAFNTNSVKPTPKSTLGQSSSTNSNVCTDEANRMEENRRKALERRAAQQKSVPRNPHPNTYSSKEQNSPYTNASSSENDNNGQLSLLQKPVKNFYKKSQAKDSTVLSHSVTSGDGPYGETQSTGTKATFGNTVNGTFRLQSQERFVVDVGYHTQLIEVLKTMTTKQYDAVSRRWNFSLSEHDKLVTALNPLRPAVCISPLPQYVRKALKSASHQVPASSVDLFGLDPKLLDALMPFQHEGVCFGISHGGRVMFADDMGLGKTIQALGVAAHYRREWPMLVVTPSSVRYSWASAVERWVGSINKADIVVVNSGRDYFDGAEVVIMSYDLLSRKAKEVLDHNFQVVILDESHMIKSFKAARYKAAKPVMKKAKRVMLLSGTPALSRPSELYTQISGIDRSLFPSFQEYGVRYCNGKQHLWGWDFAGSSNMEELQIILQSKLMIRRLKSEVLKQLPAKQRTTVILDPSSVQSGTKAMQEAARQLGLKTLKSSEKRSALLQFFAETAYAKQKAVSEYIKELVESDKKFLVFAHHRVMMDKLCNTCDSVNCRYVRIDGRTSGELRQNLVSKFQTCDDVKIAILSITAANAGITLTAAHLVIFAELFWNPGILVQAEDRVHRIGQEDCVMVQYLVAKGTADDYIWPLVQSKLEVLNKAGLSKDSFYVADSTCQKRTEQESIMKYFSELGDCNEDPTDEPGSKKQKV